MNLLDAFTILTHTATQLTGRWLPAPNTGATVQSLELMYWDTKIAQGLRRGVHVSEFDSCDWEDLLFEDKMQNAPLLSSLFYLLARKPQLGYEIAAATATHLKSLEEAGGDYILFYDSCYPDCLRTIAKPPLMLSILGNKACLKLPKISVIGSRQVSFYALKETILLGEGLARLPVCVVSGGAIGCDIAVHQGMLASGESDLSACVVFAGGLSGLYPRRHLDIFHRLLVAGGALVSERLWWQSSQPRDFPIRNRIVSGLSFAVVVMQAGESSGALITANEALAEGRDVFVLCHELTDVRAAGSLRLIEDGALSFECASEFLDVLSGMALSRNYNFLSEGACHVRQKIDTVMGEHLPN